MKTIIKQALVIVIAATFLYSMTAIDTSKAQSMPWQFSPVQIGEWLGKVLTIGDFYGNEYPSSTGYVLSYNYDHRFNYSPDYTYVEYGPLVNTIYGDYQFSNYYRHAWFTTSVTPPNNVFRIAWTMSGNPEDAFYSEVGGLAYKFQSNTWTSDWVYCAQDVFSASWENDIPISPVNYEASWLRCTSSAWFECVNSGPPQTFVYNTYILDVVMDRMTDTSENGQWQCDEYQSLISGASVTHPA